MDDALTLTWETQDRKVRPAGSRRRPDVGSRGVTAHERLLAGRQLRLGRADFIQFFQKIIQTLREFTKTARQI